MSTRRSLDPSVVEMLMKKEIESLKLGVEIMGVACKDSNGMITSNMDLPSDSSSSRAVSKLTIQQIGNPCKGGEEQVWWHTHNDALSVLSKEDRLSGGDLHGMLGANYICAAGVEGYSCHVLNKNPPLVFHDKWGDGYFNTLKKYSMDKQNVFDLNDEWILEPTSVTDMHHLHCTSSSNDGIDCVSIDWDTGFTEFPVGTVDHVIVTGSVDVMKTNDRLSILAAPNDNKLECISIKKRDGEASLLYCR